MLSRTSYSQTLGSVNEYMGQSMTTFCGSLHYIVPEMLLGQSYDGPGVDAWNLGVILYRMVSGKLPYVADNIKELQQKIPREKYYVSYFISSELVDILGKCLTVETHHRGTLEELLRYSWTNMRQEKLRPYQEPPCDIINSQVIQVMINMGFKKKNLRRPSEARNMTQQ